MHSLHYKYKRHKQTLIGLVQGHQKGLRALEKLFFFNNQYNRICFADYLNKCLNSGRQHKSKSGSTEVRQPAIRFIINCAKYDYKFNRPPYKKRYK